MARLAVPLAFARVAFLSMLAFRLRFYTGIFTYLIYVAIYTSIWRAVYSHPAAREHLAGFADFETLFTWFAIGWLARSFTFNNVDRQISELVESGHIASRVARPVSLHVQMLASALGETAFRVACFSPLIAAALFLMFDLKPPASAAAFGLFLVGVALAIVILIEVNFLVGLLAFRTKSILGITRAKQYLLELLSGLLIPLAYFPDGLRIVAHLTPFPALTAIPNQLYLGMASGRDAAASLGVSLAWAVGLTAAAHLAGRAACRSLTIQGG